jgi:phage terminase small subunit
METFKMLEVAFAEQRMGRTQVSVWCTKFESSMTSAEDAKCTGLPLTAKQMRERIQPVLKTCRSTIL